MGALLSYSLYSSVFLLFGYATYRMLLSGEKQSGLNRVALLIIYLTSFAGVALSSLWPEMLHQPLSVSAVIATFDMPQATVEAAPAPTQWFVRILPAIFLAGAAAVAALTLLSIIRLALIVRMGKRTRHEGVTTIVLENCAVPFSFMHYIVLGKQDMQCNADVVTAHESAHMQGHHWIDLIVAQTACILMWYNPAAWLMRRELRTVHENQADEAVLRKGFDAAKYQQLLIEKAAGVGLESLANSLNHSNIYKRITMMNKQTNRAARRLRVLALAPALMLAAAATSAPAVASAIGSIETESASVIAMPETKGKVTNISASGQAKPEKLPQYPGGESELYRYIATNIKYPAEAMKRNEQGRVVVRFMVGADGRVSDVSVLRGVSSDLDAEAVRVVENMPAWIPASDKNGRPVACTYSLPVHFALSGGNEEKAAEKPADKTLDEVQVIGYGTMKKADGAVSSTKPADKTVVVNLNTTDDKNNPYVTVDGKPCADMKSIDPNTIESVTVRKEDPNYPNGVVEIKLKK